jgi:hypothetical protein
LNVAFWRSVRCKRTHRLVRGVAEIASIPSASKPHQSINNCRGPETNSSLLRQLPSILFGKPAPIESPRSHTRSITQHYIYRRIKSRDNSEQSSNSSSGSCYCDLLLSSSTSRESGRVCSGYLLSPTATSTTATVPGPSIYESSAKPVHEKEKSVEANNFICRLCMNFPARVLI